MESVRKSNFLLKKRKVEDRLIFFKDTNFSIEVVQEVSIEVHVHLSVHDWQKTVVPGGELKKNKEIIT